MPILQLGVFSVLHELQPELLLVQRVKRKRRLDFERPEVFENGVAVHFKLKRIKPSHTLDVGEKLALLQVLDQLF